MPLIKPRTRGKQMVRHITRLDRENHDTLHAYAEFLGEPTEYVLNELIDTVLAKDKDFVKWRAEHAGSRAPHSSGAGQTAGAAAHPRDTSRSRAESRRHRSRRVAPGSRPS